MSTPRDRWFYTWADAPAAAVRLMCFPHAGGSPTSFAGWPGAAPGDIEVCVCQLPGRGARLAEPPVADLDALLEELGPSAAGWMDRPTVLLGHSVGAFVAFALARWLEARGGPAPAHLVVLGQRAPHLAPDRPSLHDATDEALVADLRALGGTPAAILDQAELLNMLLPTLRADYSIATTFHAPRGVAVSCPITALGGWQDSDVAPAALEGWGQHTRGRFTWSLMDGDHFFPHQRTPAVMAALRPVFRAARRSVAP